jgi:transposase
MTDSELQARRLAADQMAWVTRMISIGPAAASYSGDYWAVARASEQIRRTFGVSYRRTRIIGLLHAAGFDARAREGKRRSLESTASG